MSFAVVDGGWRPPSWQFPVEGAIAAAPSRQVHLASSITKPGLRQKLNLCYLDGHKPVWASLEEFDGAPGPGRSGGQASRLFLARDAGRNRNE